MALLSGCSGTGRTVRGITRGIRGERSDEETTETHPSDDRTEGGGETTVNDSLADVDARPTVALYRYDDTLSVAANNFRGWEFPIDPPSQPEESLTLEYETVVREGPAVDVLVLDADEYQHYRDGYDFLYRTADSELATRHASKTATLEPATYAFVVDNTQAGEASPRDLTDDATVSVEFALTGPLSWRADEQ